MKKKLSVLIAVVMSLVLFAPSVLAAPDLSKDYRFYEEITYLMDKGIVNGYGNGTVKPERNVTRAEAAIMIARLHDFDGAQQETPFDDVPKDHPASGYIAEAAKAKLISGYTDGTYDPDAPIIRGDMAIIVQRVFDLGITTDSDFKDVSSNMKAHEAIETLIAANITIGYPDMTFRPLQNVTRGEFSAFLARGLEPKFRNDATIPNSYLRDKTKTHVMQGMGEEVAHTYKKHSIFDGATPEFMWVLESETGGTPTVNVEVESYTEYGVGFPYSEAFTDLVYPVKTGKEFVYKYLDLYSEETRTITGVNKTVETPYKTFINATEVTDQKGNKHYYAEGHGKIKLIDASGAVTAQLVDIR